MFCLLSITSDSLSQQINPLSISNTDLIAIRIYHQSMFCFVIFFLLIQIKNCFGLLWSSTETTHIVFHRFPISSILNFSFCTQMLLLLLFLFVVCISLTIIWIPFWDYNFVLRVKHQLNTLFCAFIISSLFLLPTKKKKHKFLFTTNKPYMKEETTLKP